MMIGDFLSGASYALRGAKLILRPELRRFVLIPLIINVLVFSAALWFGISQFDTLLEWMLPRADSWWVEVAQAGLWVIFTLIVILILFFTFTVLANLIAAPFNGLLSEKVEGYLLGRNLENAGGFSDFISTIVPSLVSEARKLFYFLTRVAGIVILLLIPGFNVLSPILWSLYTSWMLATEYAAYPMENHRMYFPQIRKELNGHRAVAFGFGLMVMTMSSIPFINFLVMPAAVSGATALWVERLMPPSGDSELEGENASPV